MSSGNKTFRTAVRKKLPVSRQLMNKVGYNARDSDLMRFMWYVSQILVGTFFAVVNRVSMQTNYPGPPKRHNTSPPKNSAPHMPPESRSGCDVHRVSLLTKHSFSKLMWSKIGVKPCVRMFGKPTDRWSGASWLFCASFRVSLLKSLKYGTVYIIIYTNRLFKQKLSVIFNESLWIFCRYFTAFFEKMSRKPLKLADLTLLKVIFHVDLTTVIFYTCYTDIFSIYQASAGGLILKESKDKEVWHHEDWKA